MCLRVTGPVGHSGHMPPNLEPHESFRNIKFQKPHVAYGQVTIIAPQAQLFETGKDRSVSTEAPLKQLLNVFESTPKSELPRRYELSEILENLSVRPSVRPSEKCTSDDWITFWA